MFLIRYFRIGGSLGSFECFQSELLNPRARNLSLISFNLKVFPLNICSSSFGFESPVILNTVLTKAKTLSKVIDL